MKRITSLLVLVFFVLTVAGCSPARPEVDAWQAEWDQLVASMPTVDELEEPVDELLCDDVLASIRRARNDLIPTPDPTLDAPVEGWLHMAEEAFFECPPRSGDIHGFDQAYAELDRFEAEITASIGAS